MCEDKSAKQPFLVWSRNPPPHKWVGVLRDHTRSTRMILILFPLTQVQSMPLSGARLHLTYDTRAVDCSTEAKRQVFDCWPQGERCILALIQAR